MGTELLSTLHFLYLVYDTKVYLVGCTRGVMVKAMDSLEH